MAYFIIFAFEYTMASIYSHIAMTTFYIFPLPLALFIFYKISWLTIRKFEKQKKLHFQENRATSQFDSSIVCLKFGDMKRGEVGGANTRIMTKNRHILVSDSFLEFQVLLNGIWHQFRGIFIILGNILASRLLFQFFTKFFKRRFSNLKGWKGTNFHENQILNHQRSLRTVDDLF